MPLTAVKARNAEPKDKIYRLFDERGLYLEVTPKGGKYWRFKYRLAGKEKRISLGVFPEVSLKEARLRRDKNRRHVSDGVDPSQLRKASKLSASGQTTNSFEVVAREWHTKQKGRWADSYSGRVLSRLERDIFPWVGSKSIADVSAPDLLSAIRRIEERNAVESAHRTLRSCGQVFRYAIATGRAEQDPSRDLKGALAPVKKGHMAALTEPDDVSKLLKSIDCFDGSFIVASALRLAPLVFVRPGELRSAKWADIHWDKAEWRLVAEKTQTPHIVPLSKQALEILKEIHPLTGDGEFVFPNARTNKRCMSDVALLAALRRMGIQKEEMSVHGFRAMARTMLDEVLGYRPDYIEHQLAHAVRDPNGRAYNRTKFLKERREMMQGLG